MSHVSTNFPRLHISQTFIDYSVVLECVFLSWIVLSVNEVSSIMNTLFLRTQCVLKCTLFLINRSVLPTLRGGTLLYSRKRGGVIQVPLP